MVDIREVAHLEGTGQEGPAECEPCICAVQAGRYVVEILNQVAGISIVINQVMSSSDLELCGVQPSDIEQFHSFGLVSSGIAHLSAI